MTDYPGTVDNDQLGPIMIEYAGRAALAFTKAESPATPSFDTPALEAPTMVADHVAVAFRPAISPTDYPAEEIERATPGFDWFERVHIIARDIAFGSILSQIQRAFEIYNAYRTQAIELQSLTNTVDAGVTVPDLPSLPESIESQSGLALTMQVSELGAPTFDGDLTWTFDVGAFPQGISGERLILWFFEPEEEVDEFLEWRTQVLQKRTNKEQRIEQREHPRQSFEIDYRLTARERQQARLRLMDWQGQSFGLAIWTEAVWSTAAASATDTVNVWDTRYSDFRVGGLAVVLLDGDTFDVLEIASKTTTSITFTTNLQNSYPANVPVIPVHVSRMRSNNAGRRWRLNLEEISIGWAVVDNAVDLADASAYGSYSGRILISDCNFLPGGTAPEGFRFRVYDVDALTGIVDRSRLWERNLEDGQLGLVALTRQEKWQIRQLLHALRGRVVAFYLPTFADDLVVVDTLTATLNTMDVEHVGYNRFAQERDPARHLRITFTDGTSLEREVLSSSVVSDTVERLSLDGVWPSTKTASEVSRVEFYQLVRLAADRVRIQHAGIEKCRVDLPVVGVSDDDV